MSGLPSDLTDPDLFYEESEGYYDYPVYFKRRLFGDELSIPRFALAARQVFAFATTEATPSQGTSLSGRQNVNVSINGNAQQIEFVIDSGADFNIIRKQSADLIGLNFSKPKRQQGITTAGGQTHQAPVIDAKFAIEGQAAINVELVLLEASPFNLIKTETVGQSFNAVVNANGGFDLTPKGATTVPKVPAPTPQTPTTPQVPLPPTTPPVVTPPSPPTPAAAPTTGNPIFDVIREVYRALCSMRMPLICNSPWHFMSALIILVVLGIIFSVNK